MKNQEKNMQYPDSFADGADEEKTNKIFECNLVYFGPQKSGSDSWSDIMQLPQPFTQVQTGWTCSCGKTNRENYKFCTECGLQKPENQQEDKHERN